MSQQISLYIDVQNRQLVRSNSTTIPTTLPDVYQGDTLGLYLEFLNATGSNASPYTDIDFSAAAVVVAVGTIGAQPTAGEFTITDPATSQTTGNIAFNATAATVQTAIQAALTTHWSTATVTGNAGGPYTITNGSNGAQTALLGSSVNLVPVSSVSIGTVQEGTSGLPQIQFVEVLQNPIALQDTWMAYPAPTADVTRLQGGSGTTNEIQTIVLGNNPYAGAFVVNFNSATSNPIQYNASAFAVQTALQAMSSIGSGNVSVGGAAGAWVVTFTGTLALASQNLMSTIATGLVGPLALTGSLSLNTAGIEEAIQENASTNQTFAIRVTPSGGSAFTCLQETITIYNDLIVGAPSVPSPGVSYYTEAEANALFLTPTGSGTSLAFPGSLSIASGKTFTASNSITLSGTDGHSLNIGNGGTLGTGAFAAAYSLPDATSSVLGGVKVGTGLTATSGTLSVDTPLANIVANSGTLNLSGTTLTLPAASVTISDIDATGTASSSTFLRGDGEWATAGAGTVTSVDMSVPSILSISGNPITSSGTLALTLANESANLVFAGPSSGGSAAPTFRSLVAADIPTLDQNTTGTAANVTGTVTVAHGGTGNTSLTAYAPLFGGTTSTGAIQSGTVGTTGQILTSNGSGALPTFQTLIAAQGWTIVNTTTYTATVGQVLFPNVLEAGGASITITLPTTPADGSTVVVGDLLGTGYGSYTWIEYPITVQVGGSDEIRNYQGSNVTSSTLNKPFQVSTFTYSSSQSRWTELKVVPPCVYTGTLSSGSYTLSISAYALTSNSIVTATHMGTSTTNAGALYVSALSTGSVTIKSTNSSDNDTISILIQ